jgi:hypothetical protein
MDNFVIWSVSEGLGIASIRLLYEVVVVIGGN